MNTRTRRWTGLLAALLTMAGIAQPSHAAPEQVQAQAQPAWINTWIASPEARWNGDFPLPTNLPHQLWDQTVRQVARVSIGGSRVRILLSNAYSTHPLKISSADIAL